jgi:hypothetical protein
LAVLFLGALVAGCATRLDPDLAYLYAPGAAQPKPYPLIVIPGVMGSRLNRIDDGQVVWPPPAVRFLLGGDLDALALPLPGQTGPDERRPAGLRAGGIFHETAGQDFYGRLIRTLTRAGGYRCVPLEAVTAHSDCVLFAWDWRKGMVAGAAALDQLVERLRTVRGNPALRVDIVAHSAGGLLTRYFVRFGGKDVLDRPDPPVTFAGGRKVRRAVLIGTPNYGSVTALQRAITGYPIGRARIEPETIATMPGIFELLPHPDRTWMLDIDGRRMDVDLSDPATWRRHQWSEWDPRVRERMGATAPDPAAAARAIAARESFVAPQLARAARFHRALSRRVGEAPTRYIVFGSACFPTPARCLLEEIDGRTYVRLHPQEIRHPRPGVPYAALMVEPGDGSVTKASLLARDGLDPKLARSDFPIASATFVCARHEDLTADPTFQDNLLNVLLCGAR